ncbi:EAL domain-containing protein [Pseudomonas tohonis]|uniref:EAL domain-containing protein n=1 Tax=Pseudomonas tohonis TaxID=2725477 RepID=UPI003D80D17A
MMQPPLSRWRRTLYQPLPVAILAGLLSACLFVLASLWLAAQQAQRAEQAQMKVQGERFLQRLEQVFGQLHEALDKLEAQPLRGCDMAMVETLRQINFRYRFIYEAAFIGGGQRCSSWPRQNSFGPERPADIVGQRQSYWLNSTDQPDDNLAALVVGRGYFRLSTSRGHLSDMVELPAGASLLLLPKSTGAALPILGLAQPWPPGAEWPMPKDYELEVNADRLAYRMPTQTPEFDLLVMTPRGELLARARDALLGWLPVAALLSLLCGVLAYYAMCRRQSLSGELQGAIRRRELRVRYQPLFDLASRRCVGAEALVRWRRTDGNMMSPDLFIPLAESTGQIRDITDFMIEQVLAQQSAFLRDNPELYISINLAACDVGSPRIAPLTAALLARYQVPARQIAFEVTEHGLADIQAAQEVLGQLRAQGHRILIDDFGTGYSSLAYLQALPADVLKIDKAFVDALGHDAASSGVAPHIVHMAQALQLKVVAEGIEHEAQALFLASEGAHYGQGWLFSRPLTAARFRDLVAGQLDLAQALNDETLPAA